MYTAIKNTEHKGVYKKEHFKKEWRKQGASIRQFNSDELEAALKWAGVKNLSIPDSTDSDIAKNTPPKNNPKKLNTPEHPVLNIINTFKKNGALGVCITTRNLGDLIIKLNQVYVLGVNDTWNNFGNIDNSEFFDSFEYILKDNYTLKNNTEYNFLKISYNSAFTVMSDSFLKLENFWATTTSNSIEYEEYNIDSLFEFEQNSYYDEPKPFDFTNEYYLNINDIVGIKEIGFIHSGYTKLIPSKYNLDFTICLNKFGYNKLLKILNYFDIEDINTFNY